MEEGEGYKKRETEKKVKLEDEEGRAKERARERARERNVGRKKQGER